MATDWQWTREFVQSEFLGLGEWRWTFNGLVPPGRSLQRLIVRPAISASLTINQTPAPVPRWVGAPARVELDISRVVAGNLVTYYYDLQTIAVPIERYTQLEAQSQFGWSLWEGLHGEWDIDFQPRYRSAGAEDYITVLLGYYTYSTFNHDFYKYLLATGTMNVAMLTSGD